jgi:hypothetical protein
VPRARTASVMKAMVIPVTTSSCSTTVEGPRHAQESRVNACWVPYGTTTTTGPSFQMPLPVEMWRALPDR